MRAAFFDLDGTLVKGYASVNFVDYMSKKGSMDRNLFFEIMETIKLYKSGKLSYLKTVSKITKTVAKSFKGLRKDFVVQESISFVKTLDYFSYTKNILNKFNGMKKFFISASPSENVSAVANYLGINDFSANIHEIKSGKYTGKITLDLTKKGEKRKAIIKLSNKFSVDLSKSYAFGDTENDLEFLELVGTPVAVSPNDALLKAAQERGWLIMNENNYKNVMSCLI